MKRVLLLFIPLMFFFGCEEEESLDCLLYGAWNLAYMSDGGSEEALECYCEYSSPDCISNNENCPFVIFLENGNLEIERLNGSLHSGVWNGECNVGGIIVAEVVNTNGSVDVDSLYIVSISSEDLLVVEGDDDISYLIKSD